MTDSLDIPFCEDLSDWDPNDVRDLIRTTPLRYDDDGIPVGYHAEPLFGMEVAYAE
ncbi:MAG TPA: hypothetical protein VKU01_06825 [Bryobacteraceae bacterium]|nr:hypothetical protein [Bryobacteraceae bacterium]